MSKKKTYYYVLVFTSTGPVYVTGIPERNYAQWDKEKQPKDLTKYMAEDIAMGLKLNGYSAEMVVTPIELTSQPYRYGFGGFEWKMKDVESANENE